MSSNLIQTKNSDNKLKKIVLYVYVGFFSFDTNTNDGINNLPGAPAYPSASTNVLFPAVTLAADFLHQ